MLFKEFPHTDFLARAEDLVDLALRTARGEIKPVMAMFDCRTLSAAFMTNQPVGRAFIDRIMAMEGKDGVLSISLAHGFSAGDVPEVGFRVLVTTDGDKAKAARLPSASAARFLRWAGPRRRATTSPRKRSRWPGPPRNGRRSSATDGTAPAAGVPGDSTIMIETLLRHPDLPSAIGVTWDPIAVEFCRAAGVGGNLWLRIGGKATPVSGPPLDAHVVVKAVTEDLVIPFEQSMVSLGPAAAVSVGNVDIVIGSKRAQTFSPPAFTNLGIDLSRKAIVIVKSSNHFSAAFSKIAAAIHYLDSGGPFPHDPLAVTYKRVRRPIAPLDANPWA